MVIFQISPIRTGTTLIWNMLQKIFSQTKVYKANQLDDYVRRSLAEDSNIKLPLISNSRIIPVPQLTLRKLPFFKIS